MSVEWDTKRRGSTRRNLPNVGGEYVTGFGPHIIYVIIILLSHIYFIILLLYYFIFASKPYLQTILLV